MVFLSGVWRNDACTEKSLSNYLKRKDLRRLRLFISIFRETKPPCGLPNMQFTWTLQRDSLRRLGQVLLMYRTILGQSIHMLYFSRGKLLRFSTAFEFIAFPVVELNVSVFGRAHESCDIITELGIQSFTESCKFILFFRTY